jgi:hypothetical protein
LNTCWRSLYDGWTRSERLCTANNIALSICISLRRIIHSSLKFVQLALLPFPMIHYTQRGRDLGEGNEVLIAGYSKNDAKNVAISAKE